MSDDNTVSRLASPSESMPPSAAFSPPSSPQTNGNDSDVQPFTPPVPIRRWTAMPGIEASSHAIDFSNERSKHQSTPVPQPFNFSPPQLPRTRVESTLSASSASPPSFTSSPLRDSYLASIGSPRSRARFSTQIPKPAPPPPQMPLPPAPAKDSLYPIRSFAQPKTGIQKNGRTIYTLSPSARSTSALPTKTFARVERVTEEDDTDGYNSDSEYATILFPLKEPQSSNREILMPWLDDYDYTASLITSSSASLQTPV